MNHIRNCIEEIGNELVNDTFSYPDVVCDPKQGIIPRCLILEEDGRDPNARRVIVVGINPAESSPQERKYFLDYGCTYNVVKASWRRHLADDHVYYRWLREFLDAADIRGPILWTDVVKLESAPGSKEPSLQTIRTFLHRYLLREIPALPKIGY